MSSALSWDEADQAARRLSYNGIRGHLATVSSNAELDFVATLVNGTTSGYWIGADKRDGSNDWKWVADRALDRQRISPTYWAAGQPDADSCLEQYADGTWKAEACGTPRMYIVEFDAESDPTPERMVLL